MKTLKDKVVVITGAASGIGRALAVRLATEGANLALADNDLDGLTRTVEQCRAAGIVKILRVDVSRREEMEAMAQDIAESFGCVDVVVNNAGVASLGRIQDLTYETLRWTLDINLWGVIYGTKAFLPYLLARTQANLVNVASVYGLIAVPAQAAYCTSKFAVRGFTEAVRQDLRGTGVAVTLVFPAGVRTPILKKLRIDSSSPPEQQERARQRFEKALTSQPEEVAGAILQGIRRNAPRVLVGAYARRIDWLARSRPGSYDAVVARAER